MKKNCVTTLVILFFLALGGLAFLLIAFTIISTFSYKGYIYKENIDFNFEGEIIDYEQIRTINYAILVKYEKAEVKSKVEGGTFIGLIDTVNQLVIYQSLVTPNRPYHPNIKLKEHEFPDYIMADSKKDSLELYKKDLLYDKQPLPIPYIMDDSKKLFSAFAKKTCHGECN